MTYYEALEDEYDDAFEDELEELDDSDFYLEWPEEEIDDHWYEEYNHEL